MFRGRARPDRASTRWTWRTSTGRPSPSSIYASMSLSMHNLSLISDALPSAGADGLRARLRPVVSAAAPDDRRDPVPGGAPSGAGSTTGGPSTPCRAVRRPRRPADRGSGADDARPHERRTCSAVRLGTAAGGDLRRRHRRRSSSGSRWTSTWLARQWRRVRRRARVRGHGRTVEVDLDDILPDSVFVEDTVVDASATSRVDAPTPAQPTAQPARRVATARTVRGARLRRRAPLTEGTLDGGDVLKVGRPGLRRTHRDKHGRRRSTSSG